MRKVFFIFLCILCFLILGFFIENQNVYARIEFRGTYVYDKYLPENCQEKTCLERAESCRKTCVSKYSGYKERESCQNECYITEQNCYQIVYNNIVSLRDQTCENYDRRNFETLYDCQYAAWFCCYLKLVACQQNCEQLYDSYDQEFNDCRQKCLMEQHVCDPDLRGRCESRDNKKDTQQVDTCKNNIKDEEEDYVDCGGTCAPCNYKVSVTPSKVEMFADGKSKQEFLITATLNGKPIKGMIFDVSARAIPKFLESFSSEGRFTPSKLLTDTEGKTTITYYAPLANGKRFKNASVELMVAGASGARISINLKDPRPWVDITLDKRSMVEGVEMNYIDIAIRDEDSKKWKINVDASIGKLIPLGENRGGEFYSVVDTIGEPKYHLNWKPPESAMEVVDGYINFAKARKIDTNSLWTGVIEESVQHAVEGVGQYAGKGTDVEQSITFGLEAKSYYDQYKTWKGNVGQLQQDINQIKNSSSVYESFLRGLSMGTEGLQTYYGTKKFVEEKLAGGEENILRKYLLKILDKSIDYGFDSLQASLRLLADLERESKTDTIRMPVHIIVEVVDEDGNKGKREAVFQYTYHLLEKDNK